MQSNTIRVIAAVVDTQSLTLYKEDGETLVIHQGDARVRSIVDKAVPLLISQGYADIDVAHEDDSSYVQFEAASNGVVKLFRIAKSKLLGLMGVTEDTPVTPMSIGKIPATIGVNPNSTMSAVEEILQHAVSVNAPEFNEVGIAEQGNVVETNGDTIRELSKNEHTDTIIAVVGDKIIPGMEQIKTQFTRAAKMGSTKGVEAFLQRIGAVIGERKHSVEDLLKFMERGDMPIAEDGSIIIYKVLNHSGKVFVDCHTGKVEQWVGAYVCMDHTLVDHNRKNECSNGLHVARRGYVKHFDGSVCVLAKLAPEDVIAVPDYDANKMRVCGYHIIAELSKEQFDLVKQNKPISDDPAGKVLLGKALAGDHISKTDEVRITDHKGEGVVNTKLEHEAKPKVKVVTTEAEALQNPGNNKMDTPIDPKAVVTKVEQLSRKDQAAKLYADGDIEALKAMKKAAKVSWEKLGVPDPDVTPPVVKKTNPITPELVSAAADAIEEFGEDELERFRDEQETNKSKVAELVQATHGEGSAKERIHKLLAIGLTSTGVARAIRDLKKKSKKSWDYLGVSAEQAERITTLAD